MNSNFQNLPPELQERINNIVNQAASQSAQQPQQTPAPLSNQHLSCVHLL